MSTLIVLGNTNKHTFANSIVAAHHKSLELFQSPLENVFVVHSAGSYAKLFEEQDWSNHLEENGIARSVLTHRTIEIESTPDSLMQFISYLERIVKGEPENEKTIADLTNGTTLHKTFLSIVAYILDLEHLYAIDIIKLSTMTKERGYLSPEVLLPSYTPAPASSQLDKIAYLNLAEVIRYKRIIQQHTERYVQINQSAADKEFFADNLTHSVRLKLQADRKEQLDKATYRIASSALSVSIEDLIRLMIEKFSVGNPEGKTFGQNLHMLQQRIERESAPTFDIEFFRRFNEFMLYLRNSTTHKGRLLTDVEKFKAELSVKMAFPFIEFYTDIVHDVLATTNAPMRPTRITKIPLPQQPPETTLYYGLDGDNTGTILEDLFCLVSDEQAFRDLSSKITEGINEIAKFIRQSKYGTIVFAAGDDLLFKGRFDYAQLQHMQEIYFDRSQLTCSIGFGRSFKEVYLALKSAKTEPGKNSIVGIEFYVAE